MEKQIDEYQVRISQLLKNENESYKFKQELNELVKERDIDKLRIRELIEKTTRQELEIKNLLNEHHNLNEEMQYYKNKSSTASILTNQTTTSMLSTTIYNQQPFMDASSNNNSTDLFTTNFESQSTNSLKSKILQLELDKKKYEYEINMMKENELKSANEIYLRDFEIENLNKEIRELNLKVENSKLEHNESEKIKELSLQLIKLQFDEKQLRKIKLDEENELMVTLRQNEEALNLELKETRCENERLLKQEEKLKVDYEALSSETSLKEMKCIAIEKENDCLKREKESSEKELFKLKQQIEAKTMSLNECLVKIKLLAEQCKEEQLLRRKCLEFENEIDILKKNYKNLEIENKGKEEKIKELENEIKKTHQQKECFKVFFEFFFILKFLSLY